MKIKLGIKINYHLHDVFIVVVIHSFKNIYLKLFLIVGFSRTSFHLLLGILHIIHVIRKDVDVLLLSLLLLYAPLSCRFSTLLD
jgi:hypothetical protein